MSKPICLRPWALLCLGFCLLSACNPAEVGPTQSTPSETVTTHPRSAQIRALVDSFVRAGLPGMSVLVRDSTGTFVGAAGMADIGSGTPFSTGMPSKAASITKLNMGILAHRLAEQGLLDLDAPLERYISSTKLKKIKGAEGRTLRQLMNHTTGVFDVITSSGFYLAVLNRPNYRWQPEELLRFVYGVDAYKLGQPYPAYYSNTNTMLLMMCIEQATGRSHVDLLREQVWGPLGMTSTYMQGREDLPATTAHGYYDLYNNGTIADVSQLIPGSGNGYGGMFSTVRDLEKLMDALFIRKTLISPANMARMYDVVQEDTNYYCGEGSVIKRFGRSRTRGIGHTGRDLGYVANCFYYPTKGALILFFVNYGTNGDSRLKPVFLRFEERLAQVVLD